MHGSNTSLDGRQEEGVEGDGTMLGKILKLGGDDCVWCQVTGWPYQQGMKPA